jgi:hypothetical protein
MGIGPAELRELVDHIHISAETRPGLRASIVERVRAGDLRVACGRRRCRRRRGGDERELFASEGEDHGSQFAATRQQPDPASGGSSERAVQAESCRQPTGSRALGSGCGGEIRRVLSGHDAVAACALGCVEPLVGVLVEDVVVKALATGEDGNPE